MLRYIQGGARGQEDLQAVQAHINPGWPAGV